MSSSRKALVRNAYNKIKSGDCATLDDLARHYDPAAHPDVLSGAEPAESHYKHYLSLWDAKKPTDQITYAQFEDFYFAISAAVPDDASFTRLLKAEWHI
jgi:hypothetical protein